jgi:hypothetical protein
MKYLGATIGWAFLTVVGYSLNGMNCAFPALLITVFCAVGTFFSFRRVFRGGLRPHIDRILSN